MGDRIHAELLENPALEEGKEENATDNEYSDTENAEDGMDSDANDYDSLSDYLTEDDIPDYKLQENNRSKDEQAEDIPFSDSTSFYEVLKEQLRERNLTEHQCDLVEYLIGSLDDDGLLRKSLESTSQLFLIQFQELLIVRFSGTPVTLQESRNTFTWHRIPTSIRYKRALGN